MKWNLIGAVRRQSTWRQRCILLLGALTLLVVSNLDKPLVLAHTEQRRVYQESPLSPLATPVTTSITTSLPSTLTSTAPTTLTAALTSPLPAPSMPTLTTIITAPVSVTATQPAATAAMPTGDLVNRGQTSLLLVGAVLGGILVVIAVVIGRQR